MQCARFFAVITLTTAAACSDHEAPFIATPTREAPVLSAAKDAIDGSYIVVLNQDANPRSVAAIAGVNPRYVYAAALSGFAATLSPGQLNALRHNPNVAYIEQDARGSVSTTQTNPPWGLDRIDQESTVLNGTYVYTATGAGVRAYIVDTGIRTSHVEFNNGRATVGYDVFGDDGQDCNGHGTHVAGTVGGTVYGVAKGVRLIAVRVYGCYGDGTKSGVIAGIDWVTNNRVLPAVANLSLAYGAAQAIDDAVNRLHNAGVTVVVAAANSNEDACNYSPARVPNVITVGATTRLTGARASYSNWGSCLDLFAPGDEITSAYYTSNTASSSISGTSMATSHVTGVAALYLEKSPSATPAAIAAGIISHATTGVVLDSHGSPNRLLASPFSFVAANLSGPISISSAGTYTWQANPYGGDGIYTYVWKYRVQGDTTWTVVGTSSPSYSRAVDGLDPDFALRVSVTSFGLTGGDSTHLVNVIHPGTNITGPASISSAGTYTWQANPSGGNGTYTYVWKYRVQGDSAWTVVGTSAPSYSQLVDGLDPDFELKVVVTSAGLTGRDTSHLVNVVHPGANITGPGSIYPGTFTWQANPSGGNGTYTYVWKYRVQGDPTWTVVGTSTPSYSRTVGATDPNFELRVAVTSAGLTGSDTSHLVNIYL